jgi:hypothetical protein
VKKTVTSPVLAAATGRSEMTAVGLPGEIRSTFTIVQTSLNLRSLLLPSMAPPTQPRTAIQLRRRLHPSRNMSQRLASLTATVMMTICPRASPDGRRSPPQVFPQNSSQLSAPAQPTLRKFVPHLLRRIQAPKSSSDSSAPNRRSSSRPRDHEEAFPVAEEDAGARNSLRSAVANSGAVVAVEEEEREGKSVVVVHGGRARKIGEGPGLPGMKHQLMWKAQVRIAGPEEGHQEIRDAWDLSTRETPEEGRAGMED